MSEKELIQLPNKDLWRGRQEDVVPQDNLEGVPSTPAPIDSAMASILLASKGASVLTCTRCGQQYNESSMREHLRQAHPSWINPPSTEELVLAAATLDKN